MITRCQIYLTYTSGHFMRNLSNEPLASLIISYGMTTTVRFCSSYNLSKCFSAFKVDFISMKTCLAVKDVVMML